MKTITRYLPVLIILIIFGSCDEHVSPGEPPNKMKSSVLLPYEGDFSPAESAIHKPSIGQTIYVPVYSSIYDRTEKTWINLTTTVSIRNTDAEHYIILEVIDFFGSNGNKIQSFLSSPVILKPMATTDFIIREKDVRGGTGANFVIDWFSEQAVSPPQAEAIMISTAHNQGISFLSSGIVTKTRTLP